MHTYSYGVLLYSDGRMPPLVALFADLYQFCTRYVKSNNDLCSADVLTIARNTRQVNTSAEHRSLLLVSCPPLLDLRSRSEIYLFAGPCGGGGGLSPAGKMWAPLGFAVPFAVTIGIEVYPPPPGILSAPLLTIPGYGADPWSMHDPLYVPPSREKYSCRKYNTALPLYIIYCHCIYMGLAHSPLCVGISLTIKQWSERHLLVLLTTCSPLLPFPTKWCIFGNDVLVPPEKIPRTPRGRPTRTPGWTPLF